MSQTNRTDPPKPFKANLWAIRWEEYLASALPRHLREMADFIERQGNCIEIDTIVFEMLDGYGHCLTLYYERGDCEDRANGR